MTIKEIIKKCDQLNSERIHLNNQIFKAVNAFLVDTYGEMVDENTQAGDEAIGKIFKPEVSWSRFDENSIVINIDVVKDKWIDHFEEKEIYVSYDILDKYL